MTDVLVFGPEYGYNPATGGWSLIVDVPFNVAPTPAQGKVWVVQTVDHERGIITFSSKVDFVLPESAFMLSWDPLTGRAGP